MDDLDALLASMRAGKGAKNGSAKAKKTAASVPPVAGTPAGKAGRGQDKKAPDRAGGRTPVPADQGAKRAGVRDAKRTPAAPQPAPAVVKPLPRTTERQAFGTTAVQAAQKLFGQHDKHPEPPASSKLQQTGYKGTLPKPFELAPRLPEHHPKKHAPGSLKVGDSVWYRGNQRYWLLDVPPDWEKTSYVRLVSEPHRPGTPLKKDVECFWCHADLIELAPTRAGGTLVAQPTRHSVETREKMKKEGVTDIGDNVGTMLRGKSLDEAYAICSKFIHVPEDELRAKYRKLNPGQQRMNLGNRMRGFAKKNH